MCQISHLTVYRKTKLADRWFDDVEEMNRLLRRRKGTLPYENVRIAVLDSGIREKSPYREFIKGYKDFVDKGDESGIDNTLHGTNAVHLIFKLLDEADIYVARVFNRSHSTSETTSLMAEVRNYFTLDNAPILTLLQAIRWATTEWKVDIIAMSSGFEKDDDEMESAIQEAYIKKILIFAAASNFGNSRFITFPARIREVICVFFDRRKCFAVDWLQSNGVRSSPRFRDIGRRGLGRSPRVRRRSA